MFHRSTYGVVEGGAVVRTQRSTWLQLGTRILWHRTRTVA